LVILNAYLVKTVYICPEDFMLLRAIFNFFHKTHWLPLRTDPMPFLQKIASLYPDFVELFLKTY